MTGKEKAIAALVDGKTFTAAAKAAGVSRTALYGWLHDKAFRRALKQARETEAIERAEALARARETAIDTIKAIMADGTQPGQTRLNAAWRLLQADAEAQQKLSEIIGEHDKAAYWLD